MKKIVIFAILTSYCLWACNPSVNTGDSRLSYMLKSESRERCIGEACAKVEWEYPLFEGNEDLAAGINWQIQEHLKYHLMTDDYGFDDISAGIDILFDGYERFRNDFPKAIQQWTIDIEGDVTFLSDQLVSVKFVNFSYTGGAHPNTVISYLNLDLTDSVSIIPYESLLLDHDRLLELTEEKFRQYHEVDPQVSLEDDGRFFLNDGAFFLPVTVGYDKDEFVLYYNNYEIAPYVMGGTEIRFPLEDLRGVVRTELGQ